MQGWNNKKALLKQDELKKKNKNCKTMKNTLKESFFAKENQFL